MKRTPRTHAFKATLIALSLTAINPTAHATGVPTVDGSAILTNLQQWYQSARRWYSEAQSKDPGQFASSLVGQKEAKSAADTYISRLEKVKSDMQQSNTCSKFTVKASQGLCNDEENLKIQKIDAYISMLKVVKDDYDALFAKAEERQAMGGTFNAGDMLTAGGTIPDEKLETIDQELEVLRARLVANMAQNKEQIDMIDKQIAFTNDLRVSVAKKQFEGDSKGLADLLKKGLVVGVLQTAASDYESDALRPAAATKAKARNTNLTARHRVIASQTRNLPNGDKRVIAGLPRNLQRE
jgi:hypothetical protein